MMPTRQAQAVEDGPHPLRVALGEVVVDGDDVNAAPRHGVECGGERRDEGLALAGLHLRDLALVQDDAAQQLDVEVAHAELAPADLAGGRKDLRQRIVEDVLQMGGVVLLAGAAQLAAALGALVRQLLFRWARMGAASSRISARSATIRSRIWSSDERLELRFEAN